MRRLFGISLIFVLLFCMAAPGSALAAKKSKSSSSEPVAGFPALNDTEITMPLREFRQLVADAEKMLELKQDIEEALYFVKSAKYAVYTGLMNVRIDTTFQVSVRSGGWAVVPLNSDRAGMVLTGFSSSVAGDSLVFINGSGYRLHARKTGDRTIKLTYLISGTFNKSLNRLDLPLSGMPTMSEVTVTVPEENVEVELLPVEWSAVKNLPGKTVLEAVPDTSGRVALEWERRVEEKADMSAAGPEVKTKPEPRVLADVVTEVMAAEARVECVATVHYRIMNTELDEFSIELPLEVAVKDVLGPPIKSWKEIKEEGRKVIRVVLAEKAEGDLTLKVQYGLDITEAVTLLDIPVAGALDVDREKGWVAVAADHNIEIEVKKLDGAAPVDVSELPRSGGGTFLAFKYLERPFDLQIELRRNEKLEVMTSIVDLAAYTTVALEDGKLLTMCSYYVRANNRQFLKLNLDKDAEVWSAFVNEKPAKPSRNSEGLLLVPLPVGASSNSSHVEVLYYEKNSKMKFRGRLKANLPMPDVPVSLLMWEMYAPADYDYYDITGNVEQYPVRPVIEGGGITMYSQEVKSRSDGISDVLERRSAKIAQSRRVQTLTRLGDYANQSVQVQNAPQQVYSSESGEGVLPIKINLPTEGKYYYFQKVMPTDEEMHVKFSYMGGKYLRWKKRIGIFLAIVIALVFGIYSWRWPAGEQPVRRALYLVLLAGVLLEPGHKGMLAVSIVACIIGFIILKIKNKKNVTAALVILPFAAAVACSGMARAADGEVTLPWNDYRALQDAAAPMDDPEPLLDYAVYKVDYNGRDTGNAVDFESVYEIEVFNDEPVEIYVRDANRQNITGFSSSVKDDELVKKNGNYVLVAYGKGRRKVKIDFVDSSSLDQLRGRMAIYGIPAAAGTFHLSVPGRKLEFKMEAGADFRTVYGAGGSDFFASLHPTGFFALNWKRRPDDIKPEELPEPKVHAKVTTHVNVSEGIADFTSRIAYTIQHAGVRRLAVKLPEAADILDVSGGTISKVSISAEEGVQTVVISFAEELTVSGYLTLKYENVFAGEEALAAMMPEPDEVTSVSGVLGVSAIPEIDLSPVSEEGVTPTDPTEIVDLIRQISDRPLLFAYKYFEQPKAPQFKAARNESVSVISTVVKKADYTSVLLEDGRLLGSYKFKLETRGRQFFNVKMPEKCDVWGVTVDSQPVIASSGEDGKVLVPTPGSLANRNSASVMDIELTAVCSGSKVRRGRRAMVFPSTEIMISELEARVYVPKEWKVKKAEGNLGDPDFGGVQFLEYSVPQLVVEYEIERSEIAAMEEMADMDYEADEYGYDKKPVRARKMEAPAPPYDQNMVAQQMVPKFQSNLAVSGSGLMSYTTTSSITAGKRKGALPVQVTIPKTGRVMVFRKNMMVNETPKVKFALVKETSRRYVKYTGYIIVVLIIALVLMVTPLKNIFSSRITGPAVAAALPLAALSLVKYVNVFNWLVFILVLSLVAYLISRIKNRKQEEK